MRCRTEIGIAGGGLAGGAAACHLANAGRAVRLFERAAAPAHKICGEFLSREAQVYLQGLRIDAAALGAVRITHLRLLHRDDEITVRLPFSGMSLTRRTLDEAVLAQAARAGAEICRGRAVRVLAGGTPGGTNFELHEDGGHSTAADIVCLATGKHEMRGAARQMARRADDRLGFKMYFRLNAVQAAALHHHVEVMFYDGGYAGLQMVEHGVANLCLLVRRRQFEQAGKTWDGLLAELSHALPHLGMRLGGAAPVLEAPLTIYRVPYGFLYKPQVPDAAQLYRLGDQMAVIPSFSGDGMSIALHSAAAAATALTGGQTAQAYHRQMRRDLIWQMRRAMLIDQAGRSALASAAAMRFFKMVPGALGLAAQLTRIPEKGLGKKQFF